MRRPGKLLNGDESCVHYMVWLAMRDIGVAAEHLAWARAACGRLPDAGAKRHALDRLAAASDTLADPFLHVAVVGEFSVGKSSWLNAVLGERLLPASVMPTTTAVTQIRSGPHRGLSFRLHDGRAAVWSEPAELAGSAVHELAVELGRDVGSTLPDILRVTTAEPDTAHLIAAQTLVVPGGGLGSDVVLYDTPGANDEEHRTELAVDQVMTRADLLVVVVRADIAVPLSLIAFLRDLLPVFGPDRCVFVVTRMDVVDDADRGRVRDRIRQRLRRELRMPDPIVLEMVPTAWLARAEGADLDPVQQDWACRFEVDLDRLRALVLDRRVARIGERSVQAVRDLLEAVGATLRTEEQRLRDAESRLLRVAIADPVDHSRRVLRRSRRKLERAWPDLASAVLREADAGLDRLDAGCAELVAGATTAKELEDALDAPLSLVLREHDDRRRSGLRRELLVVTQALDAFVDSVSSDLEGRFGELLEVTGSGPVAVSSTAFTPPQTEAGDIHARIVGLRQQAKGAASAGAAAGAIVGTFLVPGLGTVIGGAIGGWAASRFGPNLAERKRRAGTALHATVTQTRTELEAALTAELETVHACAAAAAAATVASFLERYGQVLADLRAAQAREHEEIERSLSLIAGLRREAHERLLANELGERGTREA